MTKISQLPAGTTPTGVEVGPFVQGGQTVGLTLTQISAYAATQINGLTSVSLTVPPGFSVASSVSGGVQTSNITYTAGQPANLFLATPSSGAGALSLRQIAASDISSLPLINLGSGVTGTLPVANGGTGATSAAAALTALLPSQTGQAGNALVTNGSAASWGGSTITSTSGTFTATVNLPTAVSGPLNYVRTGNIVILYNAAFGFFGTSGDTNLTLTGIPAALQPVNSQYAQCLLINNGVAQCAGVGYLSGGTITFRLANVVGSVLAYNYGFTASGLKGFNPGWQFVYAIQ